MNFKLRNFYILTIILILSSGCVRSRVDDSDSPMEAEDGAYSVADSDSIRPDMPEQKQTLEFASTEEAMEFMKKSGHWDRYQQGIIPEMAEYNLKYATGLLNNEYKRFIIVDKASMKVLLYDKYGVLERKYGMACARNFGTKHRRADSRTPEGFFSAEGIYDSTDWLFTDDNGVTSKKKGQFGPRFIRIKCPNTSQIGIHGTCAPWSIGGRSSHGCIRLTNENILDLVKLVEVGMPIIVSPGPRDMLVNEREGYYVPSVATVPGGKRAVAANISHTETKTVSDTVKATKTEDTLPDAEPSSTPTPAPAEESPAAPSQPETTE